jgi:hypothetical protein
LRSTVGFGTFCLLMGAQIAMLAAERCSRPILAIANPILLLALANWCKRYSYYRRTGEICNQRYGCCACFEIAKLV